MCSHACYLNIVDSIRHSKCLGHKTQCHFRVLYQSDKSGRRTFTHVATVEVFQCVQSHQKEVISHPGKQGHVYHKPAQLVRHVGSSSDGI